MTKSLSRGGASGGGDARDALGSKSRLVLGVARILFENGQSTDQTIAVATRLASALGLPSGLIPRWGELLLVATDDQGRFLGAAPVAPAGIDMDRVAAVSKLVEDVVGERLSLAEAVSALGSIATRAPAPTWQFALAAAVAAVALAVIFGLQHAVAGVIIFLTAGAGALLRRRLARLSDNLYLQPFCAALLAGIVGAVAARYEFSSSLRLVAVCPCMVLVPGPHVLNGGIDLIRGRVAMGASRLLYAAIIIAAITAGLLLGLASFDVSLPIDPTGPSVPLWLDVIAAGIAVPCYATFFSMPPRMMPWAIVAGVLGHCARWVALDLGQSATMGAFLACVVVSVIVTPIARRKHLPFAAIGFAAVVSMIPGVLIFRMVSGLLQLIASPAAPFALMAETLGNGLNAMTIIGAMSLGLIIPKLIIDGLDKGDLRTGARR